MATTVFGAGRLLQDSGSSSTMYLAQNTNRSVTKK